MWEDLINGMPSSLPDVSEMPTGLDWMKDFNFGNADAWGRDWGGTKFDPDSNVWGNTDFSQWAEGGPTTPWNWGRIDDVVGNLGNRIGKFGAIGKSIADPALGIMRMKAMSDYNKQYERYVRAQNDYAKQKQAWETDFMNRFGKSQEEFKTASAEFQGKLSEASGAANEVLNEFLGAAKPLLAQSQEMLVPAVAALARGEVPEQWQPILDQAKARAMAAGVQAMVSAGMSPEEATAALGPKVDQDAHAMLMQLGTTLMSQGLATGQQGTANLQGAGQMSQILGQMAAMGYGPAMQEFQAMAAVLARILGGGPNLTPPQRPTA